jgi:hypothetical protein
MLYFLVANLLVLAIASAAVWWLSAYDTSITFENEKKDLARRLFRCGITLPLVEIAFLELWQCAYHRDRTAGFVFIMTSLPLTFIWCGCISHMLAHGFSWLIDAEDTREFDPNKQVRDLDAIAELIRSGKKLEAIQLCESLKADGEISPKTLNLTLEYLGVHQPETKLVRPLVEADRLRSEGKLAEAELLLNSLVLENPRNVEASMMLIRLYTQDLHQPQRAIELLRNLEEQPHIPDAHVDFAYRSINEWGTQNEKKDEAHPTPETIEEMLAEGYYGTAVEVIRNKIYADPRDFELRMKLLEIQAVYCRNLHDAKKLIRQMAADPSFKKEQIDSATLKLREWSNCQFE